MRLSNIRVPTLHYSNAAWPESKRLLTRELTPLCRHSRRHRSTRRERLAYNDDVNTPPEENTRRKGLIESAKGYAASALGATRARVDDFSAEVEYRTFRILWMTVWAVAGFVSLSLAVSFAMLTVIFGFGLPPRYAFGIPAVVFLVVGMIASLMFLKAKHSRRRPREK